ncbi:MAG: DNA polymerase III subunit delta [Ignavibacteriae bacterium HGW-Ignavibacteriae-4]|jgi:DNA polymerase-3 subunit delta|nr:MAG: DNA polymerase III subunit delta [Ignavibacteriae bacterium HGW-Ignavibacteriae-4]
MPYNIKQNEIPNNLLVFGEETFLVDELITQIIEKMISNGLDTNSIERLDGSSITEQEIVDNANNLSLISPQKLIIINNFDVLYKNKRKSFPGLVNYLQNPNPSSTLVFIGVPSRLNGISKELNNSKKASAAKSKIEKLPEVLKFLIQSDFYAEFPKLYDNEIPDWVVKRALNYKKEIDIQTANLIALSSNSIREIDSELEKLNVYLGNKNHITIDDVEEIVGINKENNVFELTKSVGIRDLDTSLGITDNLLLHSNQSVLILITLTRYFLTLFKLIDERKATTNKFQLAGKVGVNPYFIDEYIRSLSKYSPSDVERAISLLSKADEELKSTSTDNKYLMFRTLTDIIT